MILADFTIKNNEQIRSYFEGSNEYIPSSELVYLHEHPLIQNSFLHELEYLIDKSTECLVTRNVKGAIVEKFIEATIRFGILLPDVNKDNASDILIELRKIYKLCNGLLKDFNFK
jgi:hypothetical protein